MYNPNYDVIYTLCFLLQSLSVFFFTGALVNRTLLYMKSTRGTHRDLLISICSITCVYCIGYATVNTSYFPIAFTI